MSDRSLRRTMLGIATLGLGVAGYLTYTHYTGGTSICFLHGSCETVQHSAYSKLAGVPVALLGLIGYISIIAMLLLPTSENTRLATLVIATGGFGFSCYLTYREVFTIKAICPWCVSSAVMMTLLFGLSVWRFLRGEEIGPGSPAPAAGSSTLEDEHETQEPSQASVV